MKKILFLTTLILTVGAACIAGCSTNQTTNDEKNQRAYDLVQSNTDDGNDADNNTDTDANTDDDCDKTRRGDCGDDGCRNDKNAPDFKFREPHRNRGKSATGDDYSEDMSVHRRGDRMPRKKNPSDPVPEPRPMPDRERN